jgi:hypothetical protein
MSALPLVFPKIVVSNNAALTGAVRFDGESKPASKTFFRFQQKNVLKDIQRTLHREVLIAQ